MKNAPKGSSISTWKRVMDIQIRMKNARLEEDELDSLHAELQDALAQLRIAYADRVRRGTRFLRPGIRSTAPEGTSPAP